ncbi:hypothetical protein BN903_42 [Halorubrum sp. AJ67]|nr:hypothetical protein BN903_42 [Halorubrum sp. AJ67]
MASKSYADIGYLWTLSVGKDGSAVPWRAPPRPYRGRGASREGVAGSRSEAEGASDEVGEA